MIFKSKEVKIRDRIITFRSAVEEDAEALISYLKTVAGETPFLIREPEEVTLTIEQEKAFIKAKETAEAELMLLAFEGERHVGNCSISAIGSFSRYAHRCDVAIALYKEFCGQGIGRKMLETALLTAKEMGYEQAELEVAASNSDAIRLYEKLGFEKYGTFPDNMKYKDGTYEDCCWMMKKL